MLVLGANLELVLPLPSLPTKAVKNVRRDSADCNGRSMYWPCLGRHQPLSLALGTWVRVSCAAQAHARSLDRAGFRGCCVAERQAGQACRRLCIDGAGSWRAGRAEARAGQGSRCPAAPSKTKAMHTSSLGWLPPPTSCGGRPGAHQLHAGKRLAQHGLLASKLGGGHRVPLERGVRLGRCACKAEHGTEGSALGMQGPDNTSPRSRCACTSGVAAAKTECVSKRATAKVASTQGLQTAAQQALAMSWKDQRIISLLHRP
jgi:hypothetical protein